MTLATARMSVSLDGCYAGPRDDEDGDRLAGRERQGFAGGADGTNSEIVAGTFAAAGAYVRGRRMADRGEVPWGDEPPFRAPVFVLAHRPRELLQRQGGTSFSYVTDGLASAVAQARAVAGDKDVAIAGGGSIVRQALTAGLIDELELHVSPVVLGEGLRLLDIGLGGREGIELTPLRVCSTPQVTHLRYRVEGRASLVLDDRGRSGATPAAAG
jgi:dihydrofolate reductase